MKWNKELKDIIINDENKRRNERNGSKFTNKTRAIIFNEINI